MAQAFLYGNGGAASSKSTIVVTAPAGSEVTCSNGTVTKTARGKASRNLFPLSKAVYTGGDTGYTFQASEYGVRVTGASASDQSSWATAGVRFTLPQGTYKFRSERLFGTENLNLDISLSKTDGTTAWPSGDRFTVDETVESVFCGVTVVVHEAGQTEDGFIRCMLVPGEEVPPFEPYYEGERFTFRNLEPGQWTLTASSGQESASQTVILDRPDTHYVTMSYRIVPEFTYTGAYVLTDDGGQAISDPATWRGNWQIRFHTSGVLNFTNLRGAAGGVDVFLVGGGGGGGGGGSNDAAGRYSRGGGGGGGYTNTQYQLWPAAGVGYPVDIGAGGQAGEARGDGSAGGTSQIFAHYASGGQGGMAQCTGGNGGSGGGAGGYGGGDTNAGGLGGTDGGNGETTDTSGTYLGGTGQGTTTKAFGEGNAYASGGSGGGMGYYAGAANTGSGGSGGGYRNPGLGGGSGIVIIRNAR